MGVALVSHSFCCVCGTGHAAGAICPGDLPATGAERPGWRVNVETPLGHQAIGVLLAPSYDQWRARIITYPNVLWTAPGGRGTLKFVGGTKEEAEAQAIRFVERHVAAKQYLRRDGLVSRAVLVESALESKVESKSAAPSAKTGVAAPPRKLKRLPVRFGLDRAVLRGVTLNVSCEGMFVTVMTPADEGRSLLIHLDLQGHTLSLNGLVMWNRLRAEPDRPIGMGVRLSDPPMFYQSYVAALP
jgi:hypothetical protein